LDGFELETLFKWLDSEHKPIIDGLQLLIDEVSNSNNEFGDKAKEREEKLKEQTIQETDSSSDTNGELLID